MRTLLIVCCTVLLLGGALLIAQPGGAPGPVKNVKLAIPSEVSQQIEGEFRVIRSNGIPNHNPGEFPNRGNPNRISAQRHVFRMPLHPQPAPRPVDAGGMPFGVAVNGVPFDPGTAELWQNDLSWRYDALSGKINLGLDSSNAHVQPNGAYHYHGLPSGLIELLGKEDDMLLLGYAADGYPIYNQMGYSKANDSLSPLKELHSSYRLIEGRRPRGTRGPGGAYDGTFNQDYEYVAGTGDLDECNGRVAMTPGAIEPSYHYVITEEFPFISRNFKGTPDASFRRRGPGGRPGPGCPPGFNGPPPGRRPPPPPRDSL